MDAATASLRAADPGCHLIAGGWRAFERAIGFRLPRCSLATRLNGAFGIDGYVGAAGIMAAALLALPLLGVAATGLDGMRLALLGMVPALDAAVELVNRAMNLGFGATALPARASTHGAHPGR